MYRTWMGVAERLRAELGVEPGEYEDPRVLAALCGLRLAPARMIGAAIYGPAIYYDAAAPVAERRLLVAVELGRWALQRAGLPSIEEGARQVGLALMLTVADDSQTAVDVSDVTGQGSQVIPLFGSGD
jgi:hypothetical protein